MLEQIAQRLLGGGDVGKLLGPALGQLAAAVCGIRDELSQVRQGLEDVKASLGYEYGRANPKLPPFDPYRLPKRWLLEAPAGEAAEPARVKAALSSPARRGFVENLGENPAIVTLFLEPGDGYGEQRMTLELLPGRVYDITHAVDRVEVAATAAGEVRVQVLAQ